MPIEILQGLAIPFLGTTLGAACVFLLRGELDHRIQKAFTGFAAGIMVAASAWELVERVGLQGVSYAIGWTAWLDLTPPGVSKASALERVRELLDVPAGATVTVGDGQNDREMLEWAGLGVAMGPIIASIHEKRDEYRKILQPTDAAPRRAIRRPTRPRPLARPRAKNDEART